MPYVAGTIGLVHVMPIRKSGYCWFEFGYVANNGIFGNDILYSTEAKWKRTASLRPFVTIPLSSANFEKTSDTTITMTKK